MPRALKSYSILRLPLMVVTVPFAGNTTIASLMAGVLPFTHGRSPLINPIKNMALTGHLVILTYDAEPIQGEFNNWSLDNRLSTVFGAEISSTLCGASGRAVPILNSISTREFSSGKKEKKEEMRGRTGGKTQQNKTLTSGFSGAIDIKRTRGAGGGGARGVKFATEWGKLAGSGPLRGNTTRECRVVTVCGSIPGWRPFTELRVMLWCIKLPVLHAVTISVRKFVDNSDTLSTNVGGLISKPFNLKYEDRGRVDKQWRC
ncbi:hypothetical protein EVAR_7374_1 [Eumeta japonica]|uniref:Uncharacterized protein n=1 Tax=Eumeta variegata TaxID=151549 RepID=A0A4C1V696_EUMVA|nr:hypothetical protein EVAR_7374_1 [Eumeta japonica]